MANLSRQKLAVIKELERRLDAGLCTIADLEKLVNDKATRQLVDGLKQLQAIKTAKVAP